MNEVEAVIRNLAQQRGMDPDKIVRALMTEGGVSDPVMQSRVMSKHGQEPSYGPFQALIGGGDTGYPEGLGNAMLRAGFDPRNPADFPKVAAFALDTIQNEGWSQWYGPKNAGLSRYYGVNTPGAKQYEIGPNTRRPAGPEEAAGGGSRPDMFSARPGGPVEAAGGGAGSEARDFYPDASGAAVAALEKPKEPLRNRIGKSLLDFSADMGKGMTATPFENNIEPVPGAARIDAPAGPPINAQANEKGRQQLALALARLNQGTLWAGG